MGWGLSLEILEQKAPSPLDGGSGEGKVDVEAFRKDTEGK